MLPDSSERYACIARDFSTKGFGGQLASNTIGQPYQDTTQQALG